MKNNPETIRIMVVDDEESIRIGSERILSRSGFDVLTASRGDMALEIFDREPASIILLDLMMPGIDGMEVLARIQEKDPAVLVIVITGYATVETAIEAMKKGAYDFIPKPFEPDQLRIVINRAAEKIRLTREAENLQSERRQTLADLDAEKSRIRTILESLPNGVVVTNTESNVVLLNPAFRNYVNVDSDLPTGRAIEEYVSDQGLCDMIKNISRGMHIDFDDIPTYEFSISGDRFLLARGQPVLGERKECLGAVVNVVDITAMKVLDRLKSEFVAKVSHELRSPLSTIHEQLAVVINDMADAASESEQHILSRAQEKTRGLISLIGDLLDLSRIEAGTVCHDPKPLDLGELLTGIVDFLSTRTNAKKQTLKLALPEAPLPPVNADPLAIESIFGNLITNAINYTPEGGSIQVQVESTGISIRIQVIDNGFGIEARHFDRIFERFYRVKDDNTRYITGTGLGLPIVKGLVDSLGGIISVESTPGEGTTFTVVLPVVSDK